MRKIFKEKIFAELKLLPNMQGGEIVGTPEENVKIRKNILIKISPYKYASILNDYNNHNNRK